MDDYDLIVQNTIDWIGDTEKSCENMVYIWENLAQTGNTWSIKYCPGQSPGTNLKMAFEHYPVSQKNQDQTTKQSNVLDIRMSRACCVY